MNMSKVDCKVVLLGQHNVGKTCLVERFLHGVFKEKTTTTVGAAFGAKRLTLDGQSVTLGVWDTAGSERYESMSKIYYRGAKAALVCFDLTNRETFKKAKFWVEELLQNEEGCAIYLVGTKLDIVEEAASSRAVAEGEVAAYAESVGAVGVFETSAKANRQIEEVFIQVARRWYDKSKTKVAQPFTPSPPSIDISDRPAAAGSNSSCCK